jgi:hypothetical protein
MWVPFTEDRLDYRARVELAAIDAQRATEAAADLERRLDDGITRRRGGTGSKYVTLRGGSRRATPFLLVRSGCGARGPQFYAGKPAYRSCSQIYALQKADLWDSKPSGRHLAIDNVPYHASVDRHLFRRNESDTATVRRSWLRPFL